jgi:Chaperone of endosialidase
MSSKISASTTSGTALNMSADTSGVLEIQTGSTPTTAITIDTSQNVGIGTTSPATFGKLAVSTGTDNANALALRGDTDNNVMTLTNYQITVGRESGSNGGLTIGTKSQTWGASGAFTAFQTNGTERMRIDSSGSLFLNCTASPTSNGTGPGGINALSTSGDAFNLKQTANGFTGFNIWQTGTTTFNALAFYKGNSQTNVGAIVCTTSATSYATSSDYRLKENIAPMTGALAKVSTLKPVTYDWKNGGSSQGFIAHELAEVVPDCVTGEKDAVDAEGNPVYQGIDTSFLVATLTAAIQEQQAIITQLQADVAALKGVK